MACSRDVMTDSNYPKHFLGLRGNGDGGQRWCHFEIFPWLLFLYLLPLFFCSPLFHFFSVSWWRRGAMYRSRQQLTRTGGCIRAGSPSALETEAQGQSVFQEKRLSLFYDIHKFGSKWPRPPGLRIVGSLGFTQAPSAAESNRIRSWWKLTRRKRKKWELEW